MTSDIVIAILTNADTSKLRRYVKHQRLIMGLLRPEIGKMRSTARASDGT